MQKQFIYFVIALIALAAVIFFQDRIQKLFSRAAPIPANIVVDTQKITGPIVQNWSAFAQGGEEPPPMLSSVVTKMKVLSPKYIRIDHIYDSYSVVQKNSNGFTYDFSRLDKTVDDIIATGASPFFSLSYMPPSFTSSGSVIDAPNNWNDWKNLVKATIERYSGKNNRNLTDIYYEVWNEPELPQFGSWKLSGYKDYRLLYYNAAVAADEAKNVNRFFLGGPGVGSYYPEWITDLVKYISQNNLRFDFYSWHRYTKKPDEYIKDSNNIKKLISDFPPYAKIPIILSEWNIESENKEINNTNTAAAFTVTTAINFGQNIDLGFAFEVKDGPPPGGGKWGLITHEKGQPPLSTKPRYKAFAALSQLKGNRLSLTGEGTYISALSSKSDNAIFVIISNYDIADKNTENVPITFTGLTPSSYKLKYSYILDNNSGTYELVSTRGSITKTFTMLPNTILLLKLTPFVPLANYITGSSNKTDDKALLLKSTSNPLVLSSPAFRLLPTGNISFDIKSLWDKDDNRSFFIFEAPYSTASGIINRLFLLKQKTYNDSLLVFGVGKETPEITVSSSIKNWSKDEWHHLEMGWSPSDLYLGLDRNSPEKMEVPLDIRNSQMLKFYSIEAAIDNLEVNIDNQYTITRVFDDGEE